MRRERLNRLIRMKHRKLRRRAEKQEYEALKAEARQYIGCFADPTIRTALELRYIGGLMWKEVADSLNEPCPESLRKRCMRAMERENYLRICRMTKIWNARWKPGEEMKRLHQESLMK